MIYKFVNFPVFIEVKNNIISNLEEIIKNNSLYFKKPLVITGNRTKEIIKDFLKDKDYYVYKEFNKDFINMREKVIDGNYDLIIACGGGTIIDIGKYLSHETLIPMISVPTLLSSDAISSPISIIRINNEYKSFGTTMPIGVIVDLDIIKNSPKEYILAGLGDLISNISASYDWLLASKKIKEKVDNFSRLLSYMPAINIINKIKDYESIKDLSFLEDLAYGLILSGISMNIAHSSRPASGSEHNISHALDKILKDKRKLHGLQVGFSTILTTYLQKQYDIHEKILRLYKKFDFPTDLSSIKIDKESFINALKLAPRIRNRYCILNEYSLDSIEKICKEINIF